MLITCKNCGTIFPDTYDKCPNCGEPLLKTIDFLTDDILEILDEYSEENKNKILELVKKYNNDFNNKILASNIDEVKRKLWSEISIIPVFEVRKQKYFGDNPNLTTLDFCRIIDDDATIYIPDSIKSISYKTIRAVKSSFDRWDGNGHWGFDETYSRISVFEGFTHSIVLGKNVEKIHKDAFSNSHINNLVVNNPKITFDCENVVIDNLVVGSYEELTQMTIKNALTFRNGIIQRHINKVTFADGSVLKVNNPLVVTNDNCKLIDLFKSINDDITELIIEDSVSEFRLNFKPLKITYLNSNREQFDVFKAKTVIIGDSPFIKLDDGYTNICVKDSKILGRIRNFADGQRRIYVNNSLIDSIEITNDFFLTTRQGVAFDALNNCEQFKRIVVNCAPLVDLSNCSSLRELVLKEEARKVPVISNCKDLINLHIPGNINTIRVESNYLKTITIENGRKNSGIYNCPNLVDIELPESIKILDENAFRNCEMLSKINLPNDLKIIKANAFDGCISLKQLSIPNDLFSIDDYALTNSSLEVLEINSDVFKRTFKDEVNPYYKHQYPASRIDIPDELKIIYCHNIGKSYYGDYFIKGPRCETITKVVFDDLTSLELKAER